jgi:histidine ammonia-lyase
VGEPSVITLAERHDITLAALEAIAWRRIRVEIAPQTLARMDLCAESFDRLVAERVGDDSGALIYGVTSAPGDSAATVLDGQAAARRPTRLWTAMSYGDPLPERVVRGIVLARLANFLGGHAAARGQVAIAVAEMLNDEGGVPPVPIQSNGGSGEILALGTLFYELSGRLQLTAKESMALINGSPCAAALVADVALAGRPRLELAERVFALVADVVATPREHYATELEELWGDPHEAAALQSLRALIGAETSVGQSHQAAVSLRILPRVLGAARRAQTQAEEAAHTALSSVTDNPVYLPPTEERPLGAVFSTGGYHNARSAPAIDALTFAYADLCQLAERLTDHLFQHPQVGLLLSRDEWTVKPLHMAVNGWAEEARARAQPTLISLGGFGQNDVPALSFLAWQKFTAVARALDGALAGLAVVASQALHMGDRTPPPRLHDLIGQVRAAVAPVDVPRALGADCQELANIFTAQALTSR